MKWNKLVEPSKKNWRMWYVYEVSKETLADISKEVKGPENIFEISSPAGESPLEISNERKGGEFNNHNRLVQNNLKSSF